VAGNGFRKVLIDQTGRHVVLPQKPSRIVPVTLATDEILLAQALAQEPWFLLLDEPVAHLDIAHQAHIVRLLQSLIRDGMGVVSVMHDLSMAVRCFRRLILLDDGMMIGDGPSIEVLSVDTIERVFQVQVRFSHDQEHGAPLAVVSVVEERKSSHGSGRVLPGVVCVGRTL
jgi:iron complex transport system ATP-binding protein